MENLAIFIGISTLICFIGAIICSIRVWKENKSIQAHLQRIDNMIKDHGRSYGC